MRQAPTAFKPSQLQNHPTNRRKSAKKTSSIYIIFLIFFLSFALVLIIIPNKFFYLHGPEVISESQGDSLSSSILNETVKRFHQMNWFSSESAVDPKDQDVLRDGSNSVITNINGRKRRKIAYAITITKDGFFQDGAAVLAYSIFKASKEGNDDVSLVSFVHPSVVTSRPALKLLGFHVIEGEKHKKIK